MKTICELPRYFVDLAKGELIECLKPDGLLWCPAAGIGYLPNFAPEIYGEAYWDKYLRMDATPMGSALSDRRAHFVRQHYSGDVVDFGIGAGGFLKRLWSQGSHSQGFDINPQAVEWLQQHQAWCDPWTERVPAMTFWDSLEHVPDPERLLRNVTDWAFVSMPVLRGKAPPGPEWRHYRPGEHLLYAGGTGIKRLMEWFGFTLERVAFFETDLGRLDIDTFAFRRRS